MAKKSSGDLVKSLSKSNVLVIGDIILDIYHHGSALKLAAETPTIVGKEERSVINWGGAALLTRNLLELGAKVSFVSLIGDDDFSLLEREFRHKNLTKLFVGEGGRTTTVKERFCIGGYVLLRWNHLDNRDLSPESERQIERVVRSRLKQTDKLVISDYRHGLITEPLARKLISIGKDCKKPVFVDSQISQREGNHHWFKGAALFCLNTTEARSVCPSFKEGDRRSIFNLKSALDADDVIVKLGSEGSWSLLGGREIRTPGFEAKAVDTSGAGDAFFSVVSASPYPLESSALKLANWWAALSTEIMGTTPPDAGKLGAFQG